MPADEVLEGLKRIVVEDLDMNLTYEEIDGKVPLFEEGLAFDSVILVELISFIEQRFNVELREEDLNMETFKNLESVARIINEQLTARQT